MDARRDRSSPAYPTGEPEILVGDVILPDAGSEVADLRFRDLVSPRAWAALPAAVQARFSRHLDPGESRLFQGEVIETRLSLAGRILATLARLIGGPLPVTSGATGAAVVLVTEDPSLGGQVWTRTYARPGRFPQTITSVKRFGGPSGLEEYLGFGMVMPLAVGVEAGALVFRSTGFVFEIAGRRMTLPGWLSPGTCTITHRAQGERWFLFSLEVAHPVLGTLVRQVARFEEVG